MKSVCMRMGMSTQANVRTEGEGIRASYILSNVSNREIAACMLESIVDSSDIRYPFETQPLVA